MILGDVVNGRRAATPPPGATPHEGSGAEAPDPSGGPSRTGRRVRLVGYFLCAAWAWLVVFLVVWAVVPLVWEMRPMVVQSDSMRPALDRGDLVVVQTVSAEDAAVPGRVLAFDDPGVPGRVTTHRVDSVDDDGTIWTRGDANPERDSMPITVDDVRGMARLVVPLVGLPKLWLAEGDWIRSLAVVAATFLALSVVLTVNPFLGHGPRHRRIPTRWHRRLWRRTSRASVGGGLVVVVLAGLAAGPSVATTSAAFAGATASTSAFGTGDFSYDAVLAGSNPAFRWKLGDSPGTSQTFVEDFESGAAWSTYRSGSLTTSTLQARSGTNSGLKSGNNDPNGGFRTLGFATAESWSLDGWVYRPSSFSGGAADRLALTDASFDGYGVNVNHGNDSFSIERRDGGQATTLGSVPYDAIEDDWVQIRLDRNGASLAATVSTAGGVVLATVTATDTSHGGSDRVVVHGGYEYFVDDITVSAQTGASTLAADALGRLAGSYVGATQLGQPSLLSPAADTAVAFGPAGRVLLGDHPELNIGSRTERSVELWFRADSTTGRQVLYEEGGSTNGLLVYLDGATLRARAWSRSTSWTNELDATTPIGPGTIHHVVVTLDTQNQPSLVLYVDGVARADASKADTSPWAGHSDDGALAGIQGSTRFHDGTSSNAGSTGFSGTLDEVAVYNGVLSDRQVLRHWAAGT